MHTYMHRDKNQQIKQLNYQPTNQPTKQTNKQPIKQLNYQPTNQPLKQSANQLNN